MSEMDDGDRFLLWVSTTEPGLMADDLVPRVQEAAERLADEGLLTRGEMIGEIQVYHLTAAGAQAMGNTIQ